MLQDADQREEQYRKRHEKQGYRRRTHNVNCRSARLSRQGVTPAFDPAGSVLLAANQYSGIGLGSSDVTMRISNPYGTAMRDQLKESGSGKAADQ